MSGLLLWLGTGPGMHAGLGPQAIAVWLPSAIIGMLVNFQVKSLATQYPEMSGGTANYTTRLLERYPLLARIAAIGYFVGWSSVPAMNAIILTDLIKADLGSLGIGCPEAFLKVGFALLPFVLAFSGTRTLGILHLCFVFPALGLLLTFCLQGLGWLAIAPNSPGLLPHDWSTFSFPDWAKWYFIAVYAVYDCETSASFLSESKRPASTLRSLTFAAWLIPPIYLGGSWLLMQLATQPGMGDSAFLNMMAASKPFWGQSAPWLVTLLLVSSCLLSSATAVSNCPRILYQLSLDGHFAPVFSVVTRRGVLAPALTFNLLLGITYLLWGDLARIVMVTGTGYLSFSILFHLGLWLGRGKPEVKYPYWSLLFFLVEVTVLVVGGIAWDWQDLLLGLCLMPAMLLVNAAVQAIPFRPDWWLHRQRSQAQVGNPPDFMMLQVVVLLVLICSAVTIGWGVKSWLDTIQAGNISIDLLMVLLLTSAFVGIAIAGWTSLPQVIAINEAREQAKNLFITALDTVPDTILVVDHTGMICQTNPAAAELFVTGTEKLLGQHLPDLLEGLEGSPEFWEYHSECTFVQNHQTYRAIEVTVSERFNRDIQEYIVILRDITQRKQVEAELRQTLQLKEELAMTATAQAQQLEQTLQDLRHTQTQLIQTEKMSSLGQLIAGIAHEINNPVTFISGNLAHVHEYTQDLLKLLNLYQQRFAGLEPEIQAFILDIDLEFLMEDLPKTLFSMQVGADRIREIVLTLRNFSRLDEAEMKAVDLHEGIDSTLLILQHRLSPKSSHTEIQVIKKYDDLPLVECYVGQLNQAFMNILTNAIDVLEEQGKEYGDAAPTITISTEVVSADKVRIRIVDNGPGMSSSVKARLFDPFFTTKPVGRGTGLGLSISYQIVVDKHGGQLRCLSELGQGAEFLIEIPLRHSLTTARSCSTDEVGGQP
jgi:PAS domain S-box-containing protein